MTDGSFMVRCDLEKFYMKTNKADKWVAVWQNLYDNMQREV